MRPGTGRRAPRVTGVRSGRRTGPDRPAPSSRPPRPRPRSRRSSPSTARPARGAAASSRRRGEPAAGVVAGGRHGHQPGDRRGPRPGARRRAPAPARARQPPFGGSPARFTSTSTARAGRPRGRSRRRARPGRPTASTRPTARARAPCCAGAARGSASAAPVAVEPGALASSSWARFSPRSTTPGGDDRRGRASTGDRLRRGDQRDARRVAPGRAPRGAAATASRAPRRRPRVAGASAAHGSRTTTTAWRPVTPSRRWEKWSGDVDGAHVDVGEVVDAGRGERERGPRRGCRAPGARRRSRPRPRARTGRRARSRRSAPNS